MTAESTLKDTIAHLEPLRQALNDFTETTNPSIALSAGYLQNTYETLDSAAFCLSADKNEISFTIIRIAYESLAKAIDVKKNNSSHIYTYFGITNQIKHANRLLSLSEKHLSPIPNSVISNILIELTERHKVLSQKITTKIQKDYGYMNAARVFERADLMDAYTMLYSLFSDHVHSPADHITRKFFTNTRDGAAFHNSQSTKQELDLLYATFTTCAQLATTHAQALTHPPTTAT